LPEHDLPFRHYVNIGVEKQLGLPTLGEECQLFLSLKDPQRPKEATSFGLSSKLLNLYFLTAIFTDAKIGSGNA
jgi:hypothetical protein